MALLAALLALWVLRAVAIYQHPTAGGIFRWIGVDFGTYYIQASAFAAGKLEALYSLAALEPFRHALAAYTSDPATPLLPELTPYPPLFAWLLGPLTSLSPPLAFALWTALGVVLALSLAWRVASFFPAPRRLVAAMLVLASLPVAYGLWLGNVQIFLGLAIGEAFLALRSGRDLRAGVWLAALIVKPQYLILLGPILVWKRRWRALGGLAAGAGLILGASALVAGPSSLAAYLGSILGSGGVSGGAILPNVFPEQMVNWRALVLAVPRGLGLGSGMNLPITLILSGLTVVAVLPAWRGPWRPTSPRFAGQMTLLLLATNLATYHNHAYGPLLLAVPLAAHLASRTPVGARARLLDTGTRFAIGAAILAPTLLFVLGLPRSMNMLALALIASAVLLLGRLLLDDQPPEGGGPGAEGSALRPGARSKMNPRRVGAMGPGPRAGPRPVGRSDLNGSTRAPDALLDGRLFSGCRRPSPWQTDPQDQRRVPGRVSGPSLRPSESKAGDDVEHPQLRPASAAGMPGIVAGAAPFIIGGARPVSRRRRRSCGAGAGPAPVDSAPPVPP